MAQKRGFKESFSVLDRRRSTVLKKIARTGPFMMATPTYVRVKCGNPRCKCAKDKGAWHMKLHLSWSDSDGNGSQYVPVGLRKEVLEWVENYWIVKEYMKDMTDLSHKMIHLYAKTQKKAGRKKA